VSTLVFVGAVVAFVVSLRRPPGRETPAELYREPPEPDAGAEAEAVSAPELSE
jgi:hypothetical protein